MKSLFPALIISSLFFCHTVISQITGNIAPEIGISVSSFPHMDMDESAYSWHKDVWFPLPGPMVGIHGNVFLGKHFHLSTSFQYQVTGSRYTSHEEYNISLGSLNYTTDRWIKQTYHKLCLPVELGYQFRIGKVYPSIHLGYRFNYFIAGTYYSKEVFDHYNNEKDYTEEIKWDPFDEETMYWPARRRNDQITIGVSVLLFKRFQIDISSRCGSSMMFEKELPTGMNCLLPSHNYFLNADHTLSARYYLLH